VAQPILEEMIAQIERHGLEEWEDGETVALPLGLLYRALGRLDGDSGTRQSLYLRVCRLDPIQAMQFANPAAPDDQGD
jgi:type VI secretion system protein ImpA